MCGPMRDEIRRPRLRSSAQGAYAPRCDLRRAAAPAGVDRADEAPARIGQQDRHAVGGDDGDGDPGRSGPTMRRLRHRRERRARERGAVHLHRARERELRRRERAEPAEAVLDAERIEAAGSLEHQRSSPAPRRDRRAGATRSAAFAASPGGRKPSRAARSALPDQSELGRRDAAAAVDGIAQHRRGRSTPGAREPGGAAGLEPYAQQCRPAQLLLDLEVRHRRAPALRARAHLLAVGGMAADRGVDLSARRARRAAHQRQVLALDRVRLELRREAAVRAVVLRHHQHSRGVPVQPVRRCRGAATPDPREIPTVVRSAFTSVPPA